MEEISFSNPTGQSYSEWLDLQGKPIKGEEICQICGENYIDFNHDECI